VTVDLALYSYCSHSPRLRGAAICARCVTETSPTSFVQSALGKINKVSALLAPVGAVIAFLESKIGEFIQSATESPRAPITEPNIFLKPSPAGA
jgi:hypothetical protein